MHYETRLRLILSKQYMPATALKLLISLIALAITSLTPARWYKVDKVYIRDPTCILEVLLYNNYSNCLIAI